MLRSNTSLGTDESELWSLMQGINAAWIRRRPVEMLAVLHESMVMLAPDGQPSLRGREACVSSYRDFLARSTVVHFEERPLGVDVFGDTALVTYDFELTYGHGAKWTTERRREAWAFVRVNDIWLAIWRAQFPADRTAPSVSTEPSIL